MRKTIRYVRVSLMLTVALLAAAVVSTLTIDVGSLLKAPAERYASEYLKRAVTIGSMRLHVFSGHFLMEDFAIGGDRCGSGTPIRDPPPRAARGKAFLEPRAILIVERDRVRARDRGDVLWTGWSGNGHDPVRHAMDPGEGDLCSRRRVPTGKISEQRIGLRHPELAG